MAQDPYKYFRPEARDLLDQFAQGRPRAGEGRGRQRGCGAAVAAASPIRSRAPPASSSSRRSPIGRMRSRMRWRRSAIRADGSRPRADRCHPGAPRRHQRPARHVWRPRRQVARAGRSEDKPSSEEASRTVRDEPRRRPTPCSTASPRPMPCSTALRVTRPRASSRRGISRICWWRSSPLRDRWASALRRLHSRRLALAEELRRKFGGIERNLGSTIDQMDRELRQLREAAERLRLVPAGSLFIALERTARDTARALGKQVAFEGTRRRHPARLPTCSRRCRARSSRSFAMR